MLVKADPTPPELEPEEPETCPGEPPADYRIEYDFCTMEAAMYRAIFHLSDINVNGLANYNEMEFFLGVFNPSLEQLQQQFE